VIQAGRVVVKNVAGYDLPKLFVGAHGRLGLMADVTLKLYPLPRTRRSICLPVATIAEGVGLFNAIANELRVNAGGVLCQASHLHFRVETPYALVITAEGIAEDVTSELTAIRDALTAVQRSDVFDCAQNAVALWQQALGAASTTALLVRVGVPVKALDGYLAKIAPQINNADDCLIDLLHGMVYLQCTPQTLDEGVTWLAALRQAAEMVDGYAVVMTMPPLLHGQVKQWGVRPAVRQLMEQLQQRWDPQGILAEGNVEHE
jgi:D-lactate dehydrogenase (cytochrome)